MNQPVQGQNQSRFVHSDYILDHWDIEDGLPVNSVKKVIQTSDGYLWLATTDGLVRFDGVSFTPFKTWQYPGLSSNRIDGIVETPDSTLWLETEQQHLVKFDGKTFTQIDSSKTYNGHMVIKLYQDYQNNLWIGTDKGLNLYKDGTLAPFYPDKIKGEVDRMIVRRNSEVWLRNGVGQRIFRFGENKKLREMAKSEDLKIANPFFEDNRKNLWFANDDSVFSFRNGTLESFSSPFEVVDIFQSSDTLWFATDGGGFFYFENGQLIETGQGAQTDVLLSGSFYEDGSGNLWKATGNEIYRNNELIIRSENSITDFTFDSAGSLWFGTYNDGLYRIKPNLFSVFSTEEGLPMGNVYPVLEDDKQNIWLGLHGEGVVKISGREVESGFEFEGKSGEKYIRSFWQKEDGTLLTSMIDGGVNQYERSGEVFRPYPVPEEIQSSTATTLFEDSEKRLYVACEQGLYIEENGQWSDFDRQDFPGANLIRTAAEAPNGDVWFGTNGAGIVRFDGNEFTTFTTNDGLSSNLIRSIFIEESEGELNLWIGTEDRGLIHTIWDEDAQSIGKTTVIDRSHGLFDNVIHSIVDDKNGKLWMSTNRGIFWALKSNLYNFITGEAIEVRSTSYNEDNGMNNREANGGIFPSGIRSSDGRLWFPTQDGVVAVDPTSVNRNELPPKVMIEQVEADTSVFKMPEEILLDASQRDLTIQYTGLSYMVPEQIQFRYRIKELNENWTEAGTRREAFYTNLPEGEFTFQVTAANNDGSWNEHAAELAITVAPYFYETIWFLVLCAFLITGLVLGIFQWWTHRLKMEEKRLKEKVRERTKELREEKKKTEQQAEDLKELDRAKSRFFANVSHEFRTPLTLILNPLQQLLENKNGLEKTEREKMEMMLRNGQRLMRLINQILDIVKLETGKMSLNLQAMNMVEFSEETLQMFRPIADQRNVELQFSSDLAEAWVEADFQKMEQVLGNLIANAIKFTRENGKVSVRVFDDENQVYITVQDTGMGIPPEKIDKIFDRFYQVDQSDTRTSEGLGIGLALCKELIDLHDGSLTVSSEEREGVCMQISLQKASVQIKESLEKSAGRSKRDEDSTDEIAEDFTKEATDQESVYKRPEDRTNILVVEDNRDMRTYIQSVLEEKFHIKTAKNGEEALEKIEQSPPDLIVADIMMPVMDGLTFSRKLRDNPLHKNIPLLFLTARSGEEDEVESLKEGDDYLSKPFQPEILQARISSLLTMQKRLREKLVTQQSSQNGDSLPDDWLKQLHYHIKQNLDNPDFGISELSEVMHLERSQFYRKCKKFMDQSPQQLLTEAKLNRAKKLISDGHDNFSEVAYACGFNSLSYFSRTFKKHFGFPPSEL